MFSDFARRTFASFGVEPYNLADGTTGIPLNISAALLTPSDRTFVSYTRRPAMDDARIYENSRAAPRSCRWEWAAWKPIAASKQTAPILVFDTGWDDAMSLETYRNIWSLQTTTRPIKRKPSRLQAPTSPQTRRVCLHNFLTR